MDKAMNEKIVSHDDAVRTVLMQAELLCDQWAVGCDSLDRQIREFTVIEAILGWQLSAPFLL